MVKKQITLFYLILLIGSILFPKITVYEGEKIYNWNTLNANPFVPHQADSIHVTEDYLQWMQHYGDTEEDAAWSIIQTVDGGFALVGTTGHKLYYEALLIKTNDQGTVQWTKTYNFSYAREIIQTTDGGYALAGTWNDELEFYSDAWLVKTDQNGEVQWIQIYDMVYKDIAESVIQTSDGGFVLGGYSAGKGSDWDAWLLKFDANGNKEWIKVYGGSSYDHLFEVIPTSDGCYAFVGDTTSAGTGYNDVWLVKTDVNGKIMWNQTFGGSGIDRAYSVIQLADNGFVLVGATTSYGAGDSDAWILKTDAEGILQWNHTYGGTFHDSAYSGIPTTDGGFLIAGNTKAIGDRPREDLDLWMVKINASGGQQWDQTYGGEQDDEAWSVIQTIDGGFALAGRTRSYEAIGWDAWLVKTDPRGITSDIEVPYLYLIEIVILGILTIITSGVIYLYLKKKREARPKWHR